MPRLTDGETCEFVCTAVCVMLPARLVILGFTVLAGLGVNLMLGIENLAMESAIAMVVAIVLAPLAVLVINYLLEYRDWKDDQNKAYIDELKSALAAGEDKPERPDVAFSRVYICALAVSVVIASVLSFFIVPTLTGRVFGGDAEMCHYFAVGFCVSAVLALYLDKRLARATADGTIKNKELKAEECIVETLEGKFQTVADSVPKTPMNDMSSYSMALFQQFIDSLKQGKN